MGQENQPESESEVNAEEAVTVKQYGFGQGLEERWPWLRAINKGGVFGPIRGYTSEDGDFLTPIYGLRGRTRRGEWDV